MIIGGYTHLSKETSTEMLVRGSSFIKTFKNTRSCKIVGTIGPSSRSREVLKKLIGAGLNIARLNFSHGDFEFHAENIKTIRSLSKEMGRNVAILQDLQGPKIRCGKLIGGSIHITKGDRYELAFGLEQTEANCIPIDYEYLVRDVSVGHKLMMDDGLLLFKIVDVKKDRVIVEVEEGGILKNRKGVNFPDSELSLPAMTEKDIRDLKFGVEQGVDLIALSFVQKAADIIDLKKRIADLGADIPVIAKIEKPTAIAKITEITAATDGLMVARGDLGVEGQVERVPGFQRTIIREASRLGKPVIIATQMLESMIDTPRATLAEISDVANGVLENADCLMLSGEVASGKYPVESVMKMAAIIDKVENWNLKGSRATGNFIIDRRNPEAWESHEAIALAACHAARDLNAHAIVCLTLTGSIAKTIAKWRPQTPIIAITPRLDVVNKLSMVWGVTPIVNPEFYDTDVLLDKLPTFLKDLGLVNHNELIVVTAGIPMQKMTPTNMIKINRIP